MENQKSGSDNVSVTREFYGVIDGHEVYAYRISNGAVSAVILNYGGIVTQLIVPDRAGAAVDVVLAHASAADYAENEGYMGAVIGRCANRIAGARFELGGAVYTLGANENANSLHGGFVGFDKRMWAAEMLLSENALRLTYNSPDGEEGYPGNLSVAVTYTVTRDNALRIEYRAVSDRDTICNLTSHCYFNLAGHGSGTVYNQLMQINADFFTPNNREDMPNGEILSVAGTPMDFRVPKAIGTDIGADCEQLTLGGGYNHSYAIGGRGIRLAARAGCPETGIVMEMRTNQPAVQLYTANAEFAGLGKSGRRYLRHGAFCLETQGFANAMAYPHFPSVILKKGEEYYHICEYRFLTE